MPTKTAWMHKYLGKRGRNQTLLICFLVLSTPIFAKIVFKPTPYQKIAHLQDQVVSKQKEIKQVEHDFKFDDSIDGIKGRGTSEIENALYISLIFGEDKVAVMDSYYYFFRCNLKGLPDGYGYADSKYFAGLIILLKTAESTYHVTENEIIQIHIRAFSDHWLENNEYGKKLRAASREDLVETVAIAHETRAKKDMNMILQKAIDLAERMNADCPKQNANPNCFAALDNYRQFSGLVLLLVNPKLQKSIRIILEKATEDDKTFRNEKYD